MKCDCLRHCHFLYIDSSKLHCTRTRYGSATGIQNSSATTLVEALLNIIRFDERLCVSVCLSVFCVRGTVGHQMSGAPIAIVIGASAHRLTGVSRLARGHAYYSRLKRCATTLSCVRRDSARRGSTGQRREGQRQRQPLHHYENARIIILLWAKP